MYISDPSTKQPLISQPHVWTSHLSGLLLTLPPKPSQHGMCSLCTFCHSGLECLTHILCLAISCHCPFVQDPSFMKLHCIATSSLLFPCSIHVHQTALPLTVYSWKAGTRLIQLCWGPSTWWVLSQLSSV